MLGWLARLPAGERGRPELALLEGSTVNAAGTEPARAIALLRAAVDGFAARGDVAGEWLARFLLADALIWSGAPDQVIGLGDGFDAPAAAGLPAAPATALVSAVALAQLGRIDEAQALAARVFAHPDGAGWAARCAWQGLFVHLPAGRLDEALAAVDDDLRDFPRADPLMSRAYPLAYRAQVLEERGEEDAALAAGDACEAEVRRTALGGFVVSLVCARRANLLARRGALGEATAEIERAEAAVVRSWWRADLDIARACIAVAGGEPAAAGAAAERALAALAGAPDYERARGAAWLAPLLAEAGLAARAREVVDRTLAGMGDHVSPARLLALRAWLRHGAGDPDGAWADLAAALDRAGDQARHLVRREWPRLEPLLWEALERGVLDPAPVVAAVTGAFPGGEAALPLTRHPVAGVRAEAAVAAAASGSPAAAARLTELAADPDARVVAAARAAADATRRRPPPLSLRVLGPFAVPRGSWTVDDAAWQRRIAQRVVRMLLVARPQAVPEDVIFEALWPDRAPAAARRSLQVAVSCARGAGPARRRAQRPRGRRARLPARARRTSTPWTPTSSSLRPSARCGRRRRRAAASSSGPPSCGAAIRCPRNATPTGPRSSASGSSTATPTCSPRWPTRARRRTTVPQRRRRPGGSSSSTRSTRPRTAARCSPTRAPDAGRTPCASAWNAASSSSTSWDSSHRRRRRACSAASWSASRCERSVSTRA